MTKVVVVRGCVDAPDPDAVAKQRWINRWGLGHGARNFLTRRYREGEVITTLSDGEAARLVKAGIVDLVP